MDPLQKRTFCLAISIIHLYFSKICQTSVYTMHAHASYLQGSYVGIRRIRTGNIEPLYIMVASLQVSDGGQNVSKISGIFKFDVPL